MRPVRLELQAVGPYIGPLVLDFRVLNGNGLFLLHGATGSGKTMLLDAMCFALFGEATGERRTAKSLRSHHAPPDLLTEVTFDFALGAGRYRVWRQPEQERPRQRGGGMTREEAKAALWLRDGLQDDRTAGQVLAARPREVTERVHEILGFSADQFRNVTVLPQGEFEKFLNAPSQERENILEVLFQTGAYREIAEALAIRARESQSALEQFRDRLGLLLKQAEVESAAELETRLSAAGERLESAAARTGTLREALQTATGAVMEARESDRKLRELEGAGVAYDALLARRDEFGRISADLNMARRAAPIEPVERESRERSKAADAAAEAATVARDALVRTEREARAAREVLAAEEMREPERNQALLDEQRLKNMAAKVDQLEKACAEKNRAALAHQRAEERLAGARKLLEAHSNAIARAEAEIEKGSAAAAGLDRHRADEAELARVAAGRGMLDEARARHREAARTARQVEERLTLAQAEWAVKRAAHEAVEAHWVEAQAAVLALALSPGHPCPVCGSLEHPAPAVSGAPVPTEQHRKQAREEFARADAARETCAAAERKAGLELASAAAAVESLAGQLAEWAGMPEDLFKARYAGVREALAAAQQAGQDVAGLKQEREALLGQLAGWERERQGAEDDCRASAAKLEAAAALERERAEGVPADLRDARALAEAVKRAAAKVQDLQARLEAARKAAERAARHLSACRAASEGADNLAGARLAESIEARLRLEEALRDGGFAGEAQFRAAIRSAEEVSALAACLEKYQGDLEAAADRLRRAREAAAGLKAPDLARLEAALAEAGRQLEEAVREQERLAREAEQCRRWIGEARVLGERIERADRKHRVIATLAQTAGGTNARRITLQRFVQVTLLERVLAAATLRLQLMSNGRYWLRVSQENADRRKAGGLDLEIFDAHTGQPRQVSTLSGGESFLASLALALGLSDTVQSHAGGYHLESVFVDEGFGSLDPEALDLALATLRHLQQGGRLVGIISHVPELRQQIDVRLEVSKLKRGSTARFVVAGTGSSGEPVSPANWG